MGTFRNLVAMLMLIVLASCSSLFDKSAGDRAVTRFHDLYNQGSYDVIYKESTDDLKSAAKIDRFGRILSDVRGKLGAAGSYELKGFNIVQDVNEVGYVKVLYATKFEQALAEETFTFRRVGSDYRVAGYWVVSEALAPR